jgi:S-adenosylmethionine-diacylglycerol 3-amino-3-carboxypropyl transferase
MRSEVAERADFSQIRYAQCWEDADILLEALDVRPGDVCLSIASAGDNTLALLTQDPERVIAVDLNPAQIACLELRVAAYRTLTHAELLELMGSRPSCRRDELYRRCRVAMSSDARWFWDARPGEIAGGVGSAGKFERYLALFRRHILPLVQSRARIDRLLDGLSPDERKWFYDFEWDNLRWRLMFRIFFSKAVLGRVGRDPAFFRYVDGGIAARLTERVRHVAMTLNAAANPYLHWMLTGRHGAELPCALRHQNFEMIRNNLHRLEWRCRSLDEVLDDIGNDPIDRFNLSDMFEYVSPATYHRSLQRLVRCGRPGGRLVYWNLFAPRHRPDQMANRLRPLDTLARALHARDKGFVYGDFVVEEIL